MASLRAALERPHKTGHVCPDCEGLVEWRVLDTKVIAGPVRGATAQVDVQFGRAQFRCDCDWRDVENPDA